MPKIGQHTTDETRAKMRQAIKQARHNESPLRKIVKTERTIYMRHVIVSLECGHFKTLSTPARTPERTRCETCWRPVELADKNAVSVDSAQMPGDSEETPEERIKYERDTLLMLILDEDEFGPGAFDRAVEKLKRAT